MMICIHCNSEVNLKTTRSEVVDHWPHPIKRIYACDKCKKPFYEEFVSYRDESKKPILCLDFDGVIHQYVSGWKGVDVIPDDPVPGAFESIKIYMRVFKVAIYSSRSKEEKGIEAMQKWFKKHCFDEVGKLYFPIQKPAAYITIDDRAICFNGIFPESIDLLNFKPWYKKSHDIR